MIIELLIGLGIILYIIIKVASWTKQKEIIQIKEEYIIQDGKIQYSVPLINKIVY